MVDLTDFLQCPITGRGLHWMSDDRLAAESGPSYQFRNGIACLLPQSASDQKGGRDASETIRAFYETEGWAEDNLGLFGDTKAFVDTRAFSIEFTNKCIARLGKYFSRGGQYLLDAGSGPIPYDALLRYGDSFQQRVCVDLSVQGLLAARRKLGKRGVYLQGDLTNLPLKSGSMDAVTCNHVIYQIPPERQAAAFLELWRVLKPGGVAVIVYLWPNAPLAWRIERLARLIFGARGADPADQRTLTKPTVELPHYPLPSSWLRSQNWPFRYKIDSFRLVSQAFMSRQLSDDWRGRAFLSALYALQVLASGFCGKYGAVPAIIIRKTRGCAQTAAEPPLAALH